ncbi:hypothetical protein [Aeromicrobium alkaliterrae]
MRWERLFRELEASLLDTAALERDALVEELVDEEWTGVRARDLLWGEVVLDVLGAGRVEGQVTQALTDLVVVESLRQEVVVARAAVIGWCGGQGRAPSPSPVLARLGWARFLRELRDEATEVQVVRVDGGRVEGRVEAVIADAVQLVSARAEEWVPLSAVATLQASAGQSAF